MRFALATGCAAAALMGVAPAFAQDAPGASGNADIIVTATKRNESVRQIAAPISAISGDQLQKMNANSLGDYINRLPGVVFNDYQPGISEVVIRGISATTYHEQGQTTVGYYLNEVDLVEPNFPIAIPDVDTFDIDRVEVLRGPQGTLFGSSTLGGLVNYVAKTADPTKFDLAAEGLVGSTKNADRQLNYAGKAMVNIPIIQDKLAVRVMALQRFDAGYLDNPGLTPPKKGTNDFRTRGIRGSVVFTPFEGTKITYLGAYQDTKLDDQTYITFNHTYTRVTQHAEAQKTSFFLNSLRLDQDLGDIATLTVLGSVDKKTNFTVLDDSFYGYITGNPTGPDAPFDTTHAHANIKTIEARIASKDDGGPFRWLIGSSYMRATKTSFDQLLAPGAEAIVGPIQAPNDYIYRYLSDTLNTDFGIFGEATWKPVKGLELTVGGRYYRTRASGTVTNFAGVIGSNTTDLIGRSNQKDSGFTPKATITVRPNSHLLAYFTYSRGYRVGGINPNAGLVTGNANGASIPTSYGSDRVDNYEAGVKTTLLNGALTADLSIFDMEWKNIQAREFGPAPGFYSYVVNAASANVTGVEAAVTVRPIKPLSFSTSITYEDARLTSFLPYVFAANGLGGYSSGTKLPGSSKWSVSNNIDYELTDLPGKPTISLAHRYLSKAHVDFDSPVFRGNFNIFDARVAFSVMDKFRITGFVNNMFNKYGILNGPFSGQTSPAYSIVRPRTYGLRLDWSL